MSLSACGQGFPFLGDALEGSNAWSALAHAEVDPEAVEAADTAETEAPVVDTTGEAPVEGEESETSEEGALRAAVDGVTVRVMPGLRPADPADSPAFQGLLPEGLASDTLMLDVGLLPVRDGKTPELQIEVPEDVYSFVIMAYSHDGSEVILETLTNPEGQALIAETPPEGLDQSKIMMGGAFPGQFFSANRVIPSTTTAAFMVPNSPDVNFMPGVYKARLGTYKLESSFFGMSKQPVNRPVYVTILARRAPQRPVEGTLDLTLHFTGAGGLTAETAPEHESLNTALELMREAYGSVGVRLGRIDYVDLDDPTLQTIVLTENTCAGGDLDRLFEQSAGVEMNHLNLFFVDRFQCMLFGGAFDMGQGIGGISGGIPGMALSKGTTHSGVAVSVAMFLANPTTTAVVMAHEAGHFLGLFHTQESGGFMGGTSGIYDIISDTPDTPEGAAANLMNFTAGTDVSLSEGQGFVMRNSPLVKPVEQ